MTKLGLKPLGPQLPRWWTHPHENEMALLEKMRASDTLDSDELGDEHRQHADVSPDVSPCVDADDADDDERNSGDESNGGETSAGGDAQGEAGDGNEGVDLPRCPSAGSTRTVCDDDGLGDDDDNGTVEIDTSSEGARARGEARALQDIADIDDDDADADADDEPSPSTGGGSSSTGVGAASATSDVGGRACSIGGGASISDGGGGASSSTPAHDATSHLGSTYTNRAAGWRLRAKIKHHVFVQRPNGEVAKLHKQQFVNELNLLRPRCKLSNDRLTRIATALGLSTPGDEADATLFGVGTDFAMSFQDDNGKLSWMLGRCERMLHKQGRKKTIWRRPLALEDGERPNVEIFARWYSPNRPRTEYSFDVDDSNPYLLQFVISPVTLERNSRTDKYSLSASDRGTFDDFIKKLDASRALNASAGHVALQQRQHAEARQRQSTMEGAAVYVNAGVSGSGRQVRQRVVSNGHDEHADGGSGGRGGSGAARGRGEGRGGRGKANAKAKAKGRAR